MKRNLILGLLVVGGLCFISSCKDDEVPVAGISFELAEQEVNESDGTPESFHPDIADEGEGRIVPVKLVFDRPLAGDVVLKFDVKGDARAKAISSELNDYEILDESDMVTIDGDQITILKGASEASFDILIFEDLRFEYTEDHELNANSVPFETVILELESVVSGPGKLGAQLEHTLKILEDDAIVLLQWEAVGMEPQDAEVDMDVLFWLNGSSINWGLGTTPGTAFEAVFIPAGIGEGDFGLSYTYYSGNSDNLNYYVGFFTTAGTFDGEFYVDEPLEFSGNYKLVNLNPWAEETGVQPKVAQTMVKSGVNYSNVSALQTFETGSRIGKPVLKLDKSVFHKLSLQHKGQTLNNVLKKK